MADRNIFVPGTNIQSETVQIAGPAAHHIGKVLRMKAGDMLTLFDGKGLARTGKIQDVSRDTILVVPEAWAVTRPEPRLHITIAQALGKGDKFEQVLQHGTEVGASGFIPLLSERTVVKLTAEDAARKAERWNTILINAAEQSERAVLPEILPLQTSKSIIPLFTEYNSVFVLDPDGENLAFQSSVQGDNNSLARLLALVGPEGGFSSGEVAAFTEAGAGTICIGNHIMRTETAALAAISQFLLAHNNGWQPMDLQGRSQ